MALNSVDFPAPFGPMMPRISPRATAKETPSTARSPPKLLPIFSTRSTGPGTAGARSVSAGSVAKGPGGGGGAARAKRSRRVQNSPSGASSITRIIASP